MAISALLTVAEVAKRLGVTDDTVRALCKRGLITYLRVGYGQRRSPLRFTEADVEAYIARNRRVAPVDEEHQVSSSPARRRVRLDLPEAQRYA